MIGIRYPMEVQLVGDSKATLRALIPLLERKEDRSWREQVEHEVGEWWELMEERALESADPINPQRLFFELSKRLPDNAILSSDSGSSANWFARDVKIRKGMMASLSGNLATMGPGVPYAIGAKFAHPDRVVIAMVGDGAMQMNGLAELITIGKYWQRWSDPRLIVLVLHNEDDPVRMRELGPDRIGHTRSRVTRFPDSDAIIPLRIFTSRANQFADEPESELRMAPSSSGSRLDSSKNNRCGLIGSALSSARSSSAPTTPRPHARPVHARNGPPFVPAAG